MPCCYVSLARKADTVLEKRRKANFPFFLTHPHSLTPPPPPKKTKQNTKENKRKQNETKRNETKQNKTKQNETKTKQNIKKSKLSHDDGHK